MELIPWNSFDLVSLYNRTSSGHFFHPDTMRYFRSRVTENFRRLSDAEALFITTEKHSLGDTRKATIRRAKLVTYRREDDRECQKVVIETLGEYNTMSLAQAKRAIAKL